MLTSINHVLVRTSLVPVQILKQLVGDHFPCPWSNRSVESYVVDLTQVFDCSNYLESIVLTSLFGSVVIDSERFTDDVDLVDSLVIVDLVFNPVHCLHRW